MYEMLQYAPQRYRHGEDHKQSADEPSLQVAGGAMPLELDDHNRQYDHQNQTVDTNYKRPYPIPPSS